jgi:hypothetical protein
MKKIISGICLLFTMALSNTGYAESYNTGIGLRLGGITSGITLKHFTNSNAALEGIVSFGRHSLMITGLYEKHTSFPTAEGLTWFFGGGAHVGFFDREYGYYEFYYKSHGNKIKVTDYYENRTSFGLDFILGLDYKFKNAPVNISLDVKPFFDITPGFYGYWEPALSFRFTL